MSDDTVAKLFRFRSVNEYLWQELELSEIHAGDPAALNDPFDCQFDPRLTLKRAIQSCQDTDRTNILESILEGFEEKNPRQKSLGISCFSASMESPVMWSHYADSHKGVCLLYEFSAELISRKHPYDSSKPSFVGQSLISYGEDPFLDWLLSGDLNEPLANEPIVNAATKTLVSKHTQWDYEKEFRIIMSRPSFISLDSGCLKQVAFGTRTTERHKSLIRSVVERESPKATFCEAKLSADHTFELDFVDID